MRPDMESARHAQHFQYRVTVDGLRGVAVLAVLGFHAFPELVAGGYVGVDVFFVISGYLITSILARELQLGVFSYAAFYWRRVRRLFPALAIVLAVTLVLGGILLLPDELTRLGKHTVAAAAFLANIAFWRESGYFDTDAEFKPLLHLWSLGIEEQFYLIWPAILVMLWRRRASLWIVVSALVLASLASCLLLAYVSPVGNFYSPVSRFWELGAGCLLALVRERGHPDRVAALLRVRLPPAAIEWLPWFGIGLIAISIFGFDSTTTFPGWPTLLPVIGTLLLLMSPDHAWLQRRVMGSRPLGYIGLISYALYLWHWPLLSFANILGSGTPPTALRWSLLAISFVLAALTYRFVELPIRKRKSPGVNNQLVAATAAAGMAGFIVYVGSGFPQRYPVDVQALRHDLRVDRTCLARLNNDPRINYCRTTSALPPDIVVLGDSRAQAVYEGAKSFLPSQHSLMLLGRGGCPPVLNVRVRGYDPNERECEDVWRTLVRYVQRAAPRVVVVVGNGSFLLTDPKIRVMRSGATFAEPKEAVVESGIRALLAALTKVSTVIYLKEFPAFHTEPACFLRAWRLPTTRCAPERRRARVEAEIAPFDAVLRRAQARFPDVRFLDTLNVLCSSEVCSQRPAGLPILYSDNKHLSPAGGRLLVESTQLPELISRSIRVADAG